LAETVRDFRRAQIVAAARKLVAEQGLEALTFGALEERLSFTRGVITYHFASKDEIVRAVYASAIEEIDAAVLAEVAAGRTLEDKLRAVLHANVRGFVDRAEAGRIILSFWGRLTADPEVRRLNAELYAGYRTRTAKLLRKAREAGELEGIEPADPTTMGTLMVSLVIGIATQHYFEPGAIDVDAAIEEATRTILARLTPAPKKRARSRA
jgi:AcrR family transcriptional regulator